MVFELSKKRDYYEILNVSKNVDETALKKAYRKRALKLHPDTYKGDKKEGEEKFKELNEAYSVLSDSKQRQIYDQFGHAGLDPRASTHSGDPFSFFNTIFEGFGGGGGFGFEDLFGGSSRQRKRQGPIRGEDAILLLTLTLEEAYEGIAKKVTLPYKRPCETCKGERTQSGSGMRQCVKCRGTGTLEQRIQQGIFVQISQSSCNNCQGQGQIPQNPCKACRGTGLGNKREVLSVKIPPGINHGERVRVQGKGHPSTSGGLPGDLIFQISLREHKIFQRNGLDVYTAVKVPFHIAVLGGEILVPVISGSNKGQTSPLKIGKGTQPGQQVRLNKKGYVQNRRGRVHYGDMYYIVEIEIPKRLNRQQKAALEDFKNASK